MVRMEFFVENIQRRRKKVSIVMDLMIDIKGNNSELSDRFSEQQETIDSLERQTDVLSETMANESIVSVNMQSMRNITVVAGNTIKDLEESTSGLDYLKVVTDEINKKCEDGLSDLSKNLERQISVLSVTMANKSIVSENTKSMKSMTLNVENIKKDQEKFAALEKQIKELDQATEKKTQTVAFNVMDAVNYTDEAIKFSNIVLNEGDSYDKDTGIFTAPIDGIYQFNAHICIMKGVQNVNYYIKVGDNSIVTGEVFVSNEAIDTKCTSFSAAALVRKGENVRVGGMPYFNLDRQDNDLSSFSGILIRAA